MRFYMSPITIHGSRLWDRLKSVEYPILQDDFLSYLNRDRVNGKDMELNFVPLRELADLAVHDSSK